MGRFWKGRASLPFHVSLWICFPRDPYSFYEIIIFKNIFDFLKVTSWHMASAEIK